MQFEEINNNIRIRLNKVPQYEQRKVEIGQVGKQKRNKIEECIKKAWEMKIIVWWLLGEEKKEKIGGNMVYIYIKSGMWLLGIVKEEKKGLFNVWIHNVICLYSR